MIIDTFRDEYLFLSNYSLARIKYNGLEFKNSEAAFFDENERESIRREIMQGL